jgi:hypothetical protein
MAEGHETPGMGPGGTPEGRGRMGESDLLAERRARRAAESGEEALTRRAEAAEATVQTLERHVSSLQQRLREAEEDRRRVSELIEAEKEHAAERDSELRRAKQREYAEQQLRVEAEYRLAGNEHDSRQEIERLGARLGEAEVEARELNRRLAGLERQLAEAEQADGAQRVALGRAEESLQARVAELERRAERIQQGLDGEREERKRSLEGIREGNRRMEGLLGEVKGIVTRLGSALTAPRREPPPPPPPPAPPRTLLPRPTGDQRGLEMADALAAAVERLRARAELAPEDARQLVTDLIGSPAERTTPAAAPEPTVVAEPPTSTQPELISEAAPVSAVVSAEVPVPVPVEPEVTSEAAAQQPEAPERSAPVKPRYKHSQSLLRRISNRRKQRRTP